MTIETISIKRFRELHLAHALKAKDAAEIDLWGAQHGFLDDMYGWRGHAVRSGDTVLRLYAIREGRVAVVGGGYTLASVDAVVSRMLAAGRVDLEKLRDILSTL